MDTQPFERILKKVQNMKSKDSVDLSREEDLALAVMNLVSIEEHCYFTGIKLGNEAYFDLLEEVRTVRKELLAKMIDVHEGETWCISKHFLAATMRMIEVGTKYQSEGKKEEAKRMFDNGAKIFSLFWALRLKLIDTKDVRKIADGQLNVHDKDTQVGWKYEDIMKKLVNCCNE